MNFDIKSSYFIWYNNTHIIKIIYKLMRYAYLPPPRTTLYQIKISNITKTIGKIIFLKIDHEIDLTRIL